MEERYDVSGKTDYDIKSYQLEKDALEIIERIHNKQYRSLREVNLAEILDVPSKHIKK